MGLQADFEWQRPRTLGGPKSLRPTWRKTDGGCARRLGVSQRTLRRDVGGLQELGYPLTTTRGTGGGYQLSPGASLPPLVLSEDEAAAIVMGLKEIASGAYPPSGDAAVSAIAKIVQVLPVRIRRRIDSLRAVTIPAQAPSSAPPSRMLPR